MPFIPLPGADEYAPDYGRYIAQLPPGNVLTTLEAQAVETSRLLEATSEERAMQRYAADKWSVKEVVGHLADAERVFAYRALRFARADATPLPGFDENLFVPAGRFDRRPLADLAAEFAAVRAASLALLRGFDEAALVSRGVANGQPMSARAAAAIIAGHERHHVNLLRERYGLRG